MLKPTRYSYLESPKECYMCGCPQSTVASSPMVTPTCRKRYRHCEKCGTNWVSTEPVITAATPFLERFTATVNA